MPKTAVTFETVNALTASGFDPEQAVQGKPGRLAEYMAFQLAQRRGKEELQAGGLLKNLFFRKVMRANADAVLDAVKESGGAKEAMDEIADGFPLRLSGRPSGRRRSVHRWLRPLYRTMACVPKYFDLAR